MLGVIMMGPFRHWNDVIEMFNEGCGVSLEPV